MLTCLVNSLSTRPDKVEFTRQDGYESIQRPKDGRDKVEASGRRWRADMALPERRTSKGVASDHSRQVLSGSAYCTYYQVQQPPIE
jgi:hypothetical protein